MNLPLTSALLLASSGNSPPSSVAPPVDTEALAADLRRHLEGADPLLVEVWNSSPLDTSKPDSIPEPSWRAKQRQTAMRERPVVKQETYSSRKQRRAQGDRRTVKQIIASRKEG